VRCVKWPYERRIDPAHAWGVVAIGTAGLVAIPTVLATLNATDSHFRWWWPTNWMAVPLMIFLLGAGLATVPVRPLEPRAQAPVAEPGTGANAIGIGRDHGDHELGEKARQRDPAPTPRSTDAVGKSSPVVAKLAGHAFLSYVPEDAASVDQLQQDLETAGIPVWRDTADVWPGEDWRMKIRRAITYDALVFVACFSVESTARIKSHQNEELILAVDQLRMRRPDVPWLIPVRFDHCLVPDLDLGGGRTLASIQCVDLFGKDRDAAIMRLVSTVRRLLGHSMPEQEASCD
jgi:hypothetical protein